MGSETLPSATPPTSLSPPPPDPALGWSAGVGPLLVLSLRHVGPYSSVSQSWSALAQFSGRLGLLNHTTQCLGVVYDDPATVAHERIRYDACVVIDEAVLEVEGILDVISPTLRTRIETITVGPALTAQHIGPYETLHVTYAALLAAGADQGVAPPFFEFYGATLLGPPAGRRTVIHAPVNARAGVVHRP